MSTIFAERVEKLLEARKMSPAQLSRATGLSPSAISKLLTGANPTPRSDTAARIAAALHVTVDYLHGVVDSPIASAPTNAPEHAYEVIELMRQMGAVQNYTLLAIARTLAQEQGQLQRLRDLELLQQMADVEGRGEELDQLADALMSLEAGRPRRLRGRPAKKPAPE